MRIKKCNICGKRYDSIHESHNCKNLPSLVSELPAWTWYIKQLFPLTYRTTSEEDGEKYFHVWKMWFWRIYKYDKIRMAQSFRRDVEWLVYAAFTNKTLLGDEEPLISRSRAREILGFQHMETFNRWLKLYMYK